MNYLFISEYTEAVQHIIYDDNYMPKSFEIVKKDYYALVSYTWCGYMYHDDGGYGNLGYAVGDMCYY